MKVRTIVTGSLVLWATTFASAAMPLMMLEGDGVTVRILTMSDDESAVTGTVVRNGKTYTFKGRLASDGDVAVYRGLCRAGEETFRFTATQREDDEQLVFNDGNRDYRLREVPPTEGAQTPAVPVPVSEKPVAPIAPGPPVVDAAKPKANAALPEQLKMTRAEFRDINMDNVVAYTMLVPDGWEPKGHIEWSQQKTPYPQTKIEVTAPDKSRIAFFPAMTFNYSEITPLAKRESAAMGMRSPIPDQQGIAPPKQLGQWLVDFIAQNNKQVSNVRLTSDDRDAAAEKAMTDQRQALGNNANGGTWEVHVVTFTYDLDGVPFTEQIHLTYARNPPVETRNINMWDWMLFTNANVRAPSDKFEGLKPLMYASANSLRSVPQWFTQSQIVIMQATQRNHQIGMDEIRRRGQFYNQMSDDNLAAWKKQQAASDGAQNTRVNTINEVSDFRDTDGTSVKLPYHYDNYYSDGKGNYIMTNSSTAPDSAWTKLEQAR